MAASIGSTDAEETTFDDLLLGTPLHLLYTVEWPLDLFLQPSDLQIYGALFSYLSSLRKTHAQIHKCWASLSNAQRARRRWTGLGEGGTDEDLDDRRGLLRCGWGVVRMMSWFLDNLLSYVMTDVVDFEFRRLNRLLGQSKTGKPLPPPRERHISATPGEPDQDAPATSHKSIPDAAAVGSTPALDFTTLRLLHTSYLERVLTGSLLSNPTLTAIIRPIFELSEQFVAQVERWGGDVLPALLFEGSLSEGGNRVGEMVKERWGVVAEINEVCVGFIHTIIRVSIMHLFRVLQTLQTLLETFYEQLSLSTSQQTFSGRGDASRSVLSTTLNASLFAQQTSTRLKDKRLEGEGEVRRHLERLLLRLDFNGEFSKRKVAASNREDILRQGGLA